MKFLSELRRFAPRGWGNFGGGLIIGAGIVVLAYVYSNWVAEKMAELRNSAITG